MKTFTKTLKYSTNVLVILIHFCSTITSQNFPNPSTLSTGQGPNGTNDPIWQVSNWFNVLPTNTNTLTYNPAYISNNCAPNAWIDPASLAPPLNNGNWISSAGMPCDGISYAYVAFRLTLNLPGDCNGNSLATQGNYVLSFDGYVDNILIDVLINGVSENIPALPGGSYAAGGQVNITLDGPWQNGVNYVDFIVNNNLGGGGNLASMGDGDPYGLFLVANSTFASTNDTDNDGVFDLYDLCPCEPGDNPFGCLDPDLYDCDVASIRQTFINAGCIEVPNCTNDCSIYFLNPQSLSGTNAQTFAQNYGANLISIQDAEENQCIIDELNNMGQSGVIWIGLNDELVEGNFVWYDQSPVTYTNWYPGEPNNGGGAENYVQIYADGSWNDLGFGGSSQSIIEVNLCPTVFAGIDEVICAGATANLNASNTLFGSNPYSYLWSNGTIGQANPVSPTLETNYIVTSTDRYDCKVTDTVKVTVNTNPTPLSSYTVDCISFLAQFTDLSSVTDMSSSVSQWLWDFGDGNTSSLQNPTHQYAGSGIYNATLTVTTTTNCTSNQNFSVNIPTPTTVRITDNNPLCNPNKLNWATWNNVGANSASATISSAINLTVTHSNGGMSTTPQMFNGTVFPTQFNVPINNTALRNDLFGLFTICFNTPVANPQIAFSSIGNPVTPVQINTYVPYNTIWNGQGMVYNNNTTLTGTEGFTIITFPGTHNCISFDYLQSEAYCNIAIGIQDTNCQVKPVICQGESLTLSATGALDYIWSPALGLNTTTGNTVIATPMVTTTYYATDLNDVGCSVRDSVKIIVNPKPISKFTHTDVCLGNPITFNYLSSISSGGTISNNVWDFGDGSPIVTNANPSHTYNTAGTYSVNLSDTSDLGCIGDTTISVSVYSNPTSDFTTANVCANATTVFTGSSIPNEGTITAWNWDFETDGIFDNASENPTQLYPLAGTYNATLAVTTSNGCRDTITKAVTVLALPTANFSATTVCQGVATSFTNLSVSTSGTINTWAWDFENDGIIDATNQNPTKIFATAGTFNTHLTITNSNNCSKDTIITVTVNPNPVVDFQWVNVCENTAMNFTNISSPAVSIANYSWTFGDASPAENTISPSHLYAQPGLYNVTLTATTNSGCSANKMNPVSVYTNPVANFTFNSVCDQSPVIFQNQSNGNGALIASVTYDFTNDGTIDFNGNNAVHTYPQPGNYFTNQTVTTVNGCQNTVTKEIIVFPNPVAAITGQNVCQGFPVNFTNNSTTTPGNMLSYNWDFGNGSTSTLQTPTETYANQGVFNVSLTVRDNNNCTNMVTIPVEIYPTPLAQFITNDVCDGGQVNLADFSSVSSAFTPNGIALRNWDLGTTPASSVSGQFANTTYPAPGTYNVTLTVTSNRGCVNSISQNVIVHPNPVVNFSSPDPDGCSPWCPTFVNNSNISSGTINSYFWTLGDGTAATNATPVHCYENNSLVDQSYTVAVVMTSDKGCATAVTNPNMISVYPNPVADFSNTPISGNIYLPTINFTDESLINSTHDWNFSGLGVSSLKNPSFEFPDLDSGTYNICLHVETIHGCEADTCKPVIIEGISNLYVPNSFTPNGDGINDFFAPSLYGFSEKDYKLLIFDRWGQLIYETDNTQNSWDGKFNGSAAPLDTYVWKIEARDRFTGRLINKLGHVTLLN